MQKIFTAAQMRELDRLTVERCGISYATLMETAGTRVVEAMELEYGSLKEQLILVLCGKGNNGGDGAIIARLLMEKNAKYVGVVLLGYVNETNGETRANLEAIQKLSEESYATYSKFIQDVNEFESVHSEEHSKYSVKIGFKQFGNSIYLYGADIVVDAVLGTGINRSVTGEYANFIHRINEYRQKLTPAGKVMQIVSVDIPSGLSSDTEHPIGPHVEADLTVSFTGPKIGNVLAPACAANGKLVIANIGTPEWLLTEVGSQLNLVEASDIQQWLAEARRTAHAHKNAVGDVLLIAGSRGKTGAAALAAEAILRAGAGLATIATAQSTLPLLVTQAIREVMTEPLAETDAGAISRDALAHALQLAHKRTALAIGPGLDSSAAETREFVREFVAQRQAPIVIDADGLNALAPWPADLKGSDELPIMITPHPGEMARLTGKTTAEITADRIGVVREFATTHHVITVLKGSRTLIAAPNGEVYVNPTGNAGMATAGSGDVLTGLLAGLLAQRPQDALGATVEAVYLHGLAGDLAAKKLGQRSLIASDIIAHLSEAILQVGGEAERGITQTITKL